MKCVVKLQQIDNYCRDCLLCINGQNLIMIEMNAEIQKKKTKRKK